VPRPPPHDSPQDQQLAGENLITPNSHTHTYWDLADRYICTLAKFARRRMQLLGERERELARGCIKEGAVCVCMNIVHRIY
jgi:hypothetical protein